MNFRDKFVFFYLFYAVRLLRSHLQTLKFYLMSQKQAAKHIIDKKTGDAMENMIFASDLPYPEIEVDPNLAQSKLLMPLYAGASSELTAILTYSFQSYISPKYPDIVRALNGISVVEMHHHKLLGTTIFKLGGYPIMGARTYWNGNFANYTLNPKKFLHENILGEEAAIVNYERTILNVESESVKTLLERIIIDEEIHIKIFKELLSDLVLTDKTKI